MKLAISIVQGSAPHVWPLDAPPVRIGRDRSNAIRIRHRSISRTHAEIALKKGHFFLTDQHSHNGTWLNGIRVRRPAQLHPGDQIQMGRVTLVVSECTSRMGDDSEDLSGTTILEVPPAHVIGGSARAALDPGDLIRNLESFGRRLVSARTLPAVYDSLLGAVEEALPATRTCLFLRSDDHAEPSLVAAHPRMPCMSDAPVLSMDSLRRCVDRGTVLLLPDARFGAEAPPRRRPSTQVPTALAAPLVSEGRPIGLAYAEHGALMGGYRREHAEILTLFANMAAVRIARSQATLVAGEMGKVQHEIEIAGQIQRWLVPPVSTSIQGWDVHGALEPCEAVGGDFYDIHSCPSGEIWIVLGDVAGHGVCGAMVMAVLLSAARVLYDDCAGPAELAQRLNAVLQGQGACGRFATVFVGKLDAVFGTLRYVNAGHPYPLLVSGRKIRSLPSTGPALGIHEHFKYRNEATILQPGELLAIFTDGIPEALCGRARFFGERRLASAMRAAARVTPLEESSRSVIQRVDHFLSGAPRSDDIALLLMKRRAA